MTLLERVRALYQSGNWSVVVDDEDLLLETLTSVADMYLDPEGFWDDSWDDEDFVRTALNVTAGCPLPDRSELTEEYLVS